jgi:hypothetical protein
LLVVTEEYLLTAIIEILSFQCRKYGNLDEAIANFPLLDVDTELLNQAREAITDFSCGGLTGPTDKEINYYPKDGIK